LLTNLPTLLQAKSVSKHDHIMLALIDQRPYLSDGSKQVLCAKSIFMEYHFFACPWFQQRLTKCSFSPQAIAAAISHGQTSNSKVTVTLLEVDPLAEDDKKKRLETVMW